MPISLRTPPVVKDQEMTKALKTVYDDMNRIKDVLNEYSLEGGSTGGQKRNIRITYDKATDIVYIEAWTTKGWQRVALSPVTQ